MVEMQFKNLESHIPKIYDHLYIPIKIGASFKVILRLQRCQINKLLLESGWIQDFKSLI